MKQILLTNRYYLPTKNKFLSPRLWIIIKNLIVILFVGLSFSSKAQNPDCDPTVPYFFVDLSSSPANTWSSPNVERLDQCCNAANSDNCISFDVVLNPETAGIQIDMIGADPSGALFYDIDCAGNYPGGTIKCITGPGPHHITFCKPGGNSNVYIITAISRPIFPPDDSVRIGCSTQLISMGVINSSTNWTSIYPGALGAYNSFLSCTNCGSPQYTPSASAPAYVDYQVCGAPQASDCGFASMICDTVRVYNIPALSGSINPNPAGFCNVGPGSGVTLTGTGIGGMPPYTYTWYNSSNVIIGTGSTYFASQTGNITLEIQDAFYNVITCPAFFTTTSVIQNSLPTVSAGTDQTVCATDPDVSLNGIVTNTSGGSWSGGSGVFDPGSSFLNVNYTPSAADIANGSVTLTLTSSPSGGCPNVTDQVTIFFSDTIQVNITGTPINCFGGTSTITANVSGGIPPFTYLWNNGSTSTSINVATGNYDVTVTDAIGCTGQQTYNVIAPSQLLISLTATDATTNGGNDGTANVVASGGTPPYSYNWSPGNPLGDGTSVISNLTFGVYTVTVTDANGCTLTGSVVVNEPSCSGFSVSPMTVNVTCNGANDGIGIGMVSGGTMPYSFSWSDPLSQTNDTAYNLPPGAYTLTVVDNVNCLAATNIFFITEPDVLLNSLSQTNVSMVGGNDGTATANPSGGTPPYYFDWSPGSPAGDGTTTISNLAAGTYFITITDGNGCSVSDSIVISDPPCDALSINILTTDVSCFAGNTGSATANVNGATLPYSVIWSDGQTGNTAIGLIAGNYSAIITDAVNCSQTIFFTISEPTQLSMNSFHTDATCYDSDNGTISLNVSGGSYPYTFNWSNGSSNEDLINLGPGNYSVTVTDENGCAVNASEIITEPAILTALIDVTIPTCMSNSDGSIDLTVSGGTPAYTYLWSTGATTEDISGIQAGGYSVLVSDANGCFTQPSPLFFPVTQPAQLVATASISDYNSYGVSCNASVDGSIDVSVSGGTLPYTYLWNTSAGTEDLSGLSAGTYSLTVTDSNGCNIQTSAVITEPPALVSSSVSADPGCNGIAGGSIDISVTGGVMPYTFNWSNGSVDEDQINIGPGNYSVTITDQNGCTSSAASSLSEPAPLSVIASINNISCMGGANGSIDLTVSGGTPSYTFLWSTGATTEDISGIQAGGYSVLVSDANGCLTQPSQLFFSVTQPAELVVSTSTADYNGYGVSCNASADGSIDVFVSGGTLPYSYLWNTGAGTEDLSGLSAGTYSLTVTDSNGCNIQTSAVITEPSALVSSSASVNPACNGIAAGSIDISVTGGVMPYTFNWSNGSVNEDQINIGPGNYSVTITDQNGCTSTSSSSLSEPAPLSVIASINNISCMGGINGSIDLTVNGGTSPYSYTWSNGAVTEDLNGISADDYNVLVTDANGCTMVQSTLYFTLTEPMQLTASALITSDYNGQDISCFGANDGAGTVLVNGGTLPYTYGWSNSETTQSVNGLDALTYSVTVSDGNGCTASSVITLTQPAQFVGTVSNVSNYNGFGVSCFNSTDGNIDVSISGGILPYSFSWNNGMSSEDLSGIGAGSYSIVATDANGCVVNNNAVITEPSPLTYLISKENAGCNGASTGSIDLTVSGGVNPYLFNWSNGEVTEDISELPVNFYSVNITDLNGCINFAKIFVNEPEELISEISKQDVLCYGQNNGTINVDVFGGTNPYTYTWSNGENNSSINGLLSGLYSVTIVDAAGCQRTDNIEILQPDSLYIDLTSPELVTGYNVSSYQGNDGLINLTVIGGTSEFNYLWSDNSSTQNIQNLIAGEYNVVCTDVNGCKATASINLNQPMTLEMPTGYTPNGDGNNDNFIVHGIESYPDNLLTVFNRWGNIVYQKENYFNEWNGLNNKGDELPDGTYFVVLEINNGGLVLKGYVEMKRY